jgi:protein tyrosine/serine phosphatase
MLVVLAGHGLHAAGVAVSSTAPAVSSIRIDNFGRVSDTYYRGAAPEAADLAALQSLGIKTVIDLTSDDANPNEQASVQSHGMQYVHIPMTVHEPPTASQLATFFTVVNDPQRQPVYVHCVGGRHRTGVMTAAYRMTFDGWPPAKAFKEMKQYRFGADFLHAEFKAFVLGFHPTLQATPATQSVKATMGTPPLSSAPLQD